MERPIKPTLAERFKNLAPPAARRLSRRIKAEVRNWRNRGLSAEEVFTRVYADKMWGGGDAAFFSGPGSNEEAAAPYANFVTNFIATHNIGSVVDLGCGDFRVGRMIAGPRVEYRGIDVVKPLIDENNRQFGSGSVRFEFKDITRDILPPADLCLIREVFQHVSNAQIQAVLQRVRVYDHVLFTDIQPTDLSGYKVNRDKVHGDSSRLVHRSHLSLDKAPFNVEGLRLVFETEPPYFASYAPFGSSFKLRTFLWSPKRKLPQSAA